MSEHKQGTPEEISPKAMDLYKQANSGLLKDDQAAMALLRQATEISPDFFEAHFDFALAAFAHCGKNYDRIRQSETDEIHAEIRQSLDKCIKLRPGHAPAHAWKACIALLSNDYQQARKHADKALEIDSDNFEANLHKGCLYHKLSQIELTRYNPRKALENSRKAIDLVSKAHSLRPDSLEAVYCLAAARECSGYIAYDLGDKKKSRNSFKQALALFREAADFAIGRDKYAGQIARANLRCVRVMKSLHKLFGLRYLGCGWEGMQERIINHMTAAIKLKPDLAEAYEIRAMAKIYTRRPDEAKADLTTAQKYSDNPEIQKMLTHLDMIFKTDNESEPEA